MKLLVDPAVKRHPKIMKLARLMGVGQPTALGWCVNLWAYTMDLFPTGELTGATQRDIAEATGYTKRATSVVTALVRCKLLVKTAKGYKVHDWQNEQGDIVAKRAKWKADKLRQRESKKGAVRGGQARESTVDSSVESSLSLPVPFLSSSSSIPSLSIPNGAAFDLTLIFMGVSRASDQPNCQQAIGAALDGGRITEATFKAAVDKHEREDRGFTIKQFLYKYFPLDVKPKKETPLEVLKRRMSE